MSEPLQLQPHEYEPWSAFAVAYYSREGGSVNHACSYADSFIEESRRRMRRVVADDYEETMLRARGYALAGLCTK